MEATSKRLTMGNDPNGKQIVYYSTTDTVRGRKQLVLCLSSGSNCLKAGLLTCFALGKCQELWKQCYKLAHGRCQIPLVRFSFVSIMELDL